MWSCAHFFFFTQPEMVLDSNTHFFHTLISLPGSVAIPSFQSRAPMMSNSAPWERPSLGGVSVISTPWISVNCKDTVNSCSETVHCTNNRQMLMQERRVSSARFDVLNTELILCTTWSSPSVCFYLHSAPNVKMSNAVSTCTCKQRWPTSPLDGDCVSACSIHHTLRLQTKQSIIILFCWSTNGGKRAQTAPLEWTCTEIIDKHEKRCLNFKFTTEVHLFLVLTLSPKTGRLPPCKQARG